MVPKSEAHIEGSLRAVFGKSHEHPHLCLNLHPSQPRLYKLWFQSGHPAQNIKNKSKNVATAESIVTGLKVTHPPHLHEMCRDHFQTQEGCRCSQEC